MTLYNTIYASITHISHFGYLVILLIIIIWELVRIDSHLRGGK
jgi:hypothetical protein